MLVELQQGNDDDDEYDNDEDIGEYNDDDDDYMNDGDSDCDSKLRFIIQWRR